MLNLISKYIQPASTRELPAYKLFLVSQNRFVSERWKRLFDSQGHESPGVKTLRYILQKLDLEYLDDQVNNYDRYSYHIRHVREDTLSWFRAMRQGQSYKKLFFTSTPYITEEYLIPVADLNSLVNLPLYTDNWNIWKKVRPLRLWSHDSDEYTLNLINDTLKFKYMGPSYAIELLDTVALLFKYYFWWKFKRKEESEIAWSIPEQFFIHKYVMCDWCYDLTNIWIISCLNKLIDIEDIRAVSQLSSDNLTTDVQYGRVATDCRKAFEQLWKLLETIRKNAKPEILLSFKLFINGSLYDRASISTERLSLPMYKQYNYLRWLKDKDMLTFLLKIWALRPKNPRTKQIFLNFRRDFNRLLMTSPWNNCKSIILRDRIEEDMLETFNIVQKYNA